MSPAASGGGRPRKRPDGSGTAPKPKAAAKKPAKPRVSKPKDATAAPAKPRTRKKADNTDLLPLELDQGLAPKAAPRKTSKRKLEPAPAPVQAPVVEVPKAKPARAKAPAGPPAVRVKLKREFNWRDLLPRRAARPKAEPRPPMPAVERALEWMRNGATILIVLLSLLVMLGAAYALVNPPRTPLMWVRYWQGLDGDRFGFTWKPFDDLGEPALLAVVAAADPAFLDTGGLNPRAVKSALQEGGIGAVQATGLSALASRNVFSWPGDSLLSNGLESFFRIVIDVSWNKRRILEVYANVAEFGPGLYGIEAASQAAFGKPAEDLTEQEAATLAACLADPQGQSPTAASPELIAQRNALLQRMQSLGGPDRLRQALPAPKSGKL